MNIGDYLNNLNKEKLTNFVDNTDSSIVVKKNVNKQISDTSWIDMVEDCIPYLDNIIRNPRRFIVQEENIVPIEKTKVVTEESIRHLAQHTQLIQDVKEDGSVMPEKLLNVYREETVDLYENRFIKSLVDNLYIFVTNKLKESDQRSFANITNEVSYEGSYKKKKEQINVKVMLTSKYEDNVDSTKDGHSLEERIEHIKEVIAAFRSSTFIKSLKESSPVRSPIRKTNVILKEPNFIKALELWEYLEKNNIKPMSEIVKTSEIIKSEDIKDKYDLAFFIEKDALDNHVVNVKPGYNANIVSKLIEDFVFSGNSSEKQFKKVMNSEFRKSIKKKQNVEKNIKKDLDKFLTNINRKRNRALEMLK